MSSVSRGWPDSWISLMTAGMTMRSTMMTTLTCETWHTTWYKNWQNFYISYQFQAKYCSTESIEESEASTTQCLLEDHLGFQRPIFLNRICDGVPDCVNGEDELKLERGHSLGDCLMEKTTSRTGGCCSTLIVNGEECTFEVLEAKVLKIKL